MNKPFAFFLVAVTLTLAFGTAGRSATLTYEEAKRQIPQRQLPEFWVGSVGDLAARWQKLACCKWSTIAQSPGGRPLHLVSAGDLEKVRHRANFNSAVGGQQPEAYMEKSKRKKPVVYFIGPVHGHEVEGLTGLVNLIEIIETGRDLRGRDQAALRALAAQCRLLIVPSGNPDGTARFEPKACFGMTLDQCQFWSQGTWADHSIVYWPASKRQHPFRGPEVGFPGCYFDDAGINPMHDEFFAPMGPEAPAILRVARDEGPDLAVSLHSHGVKPAVLHTAYVPLEVQTQVRRLAEATYALLDSRGLPHGSLPPVGPEQGKHPEPFNLASAVYHASGVVTFTFECPHGLADPKMCQVTLEQILDIELTLYEAMLRYAIEQKREGGTGAVAVGGGIRD